MSSQGRGRGRGRFQARGRGNRDQNSKNEHYKSSQESAKFSVGTAKQASEFTKIKKYIINQIKMNYKHGIYIGTALEEGKDFDFTPDKPKPLVIIEVSGTAEAKLEKMGINKSNEIEFQMAMTEYNEKIRTYSENKYKAYSFMWDKCTTQMKQNLESKADYLSVIKNNPFELMKNIEALSYNYQESKYEIAIVADAIRNFVTLKQKDDESLTNYMDRFKAASDNMIAQKGNEFVLTKYMQTLDNYDSNNPTKAMKRAYEEYLAYTFIINSDNNKYGSLIKNLAQQQSLKNTQYPKTLTAASEVLMEHKWDEKYYEAKKKRDNNNRRDRGNDDSTISSTTSTSNEMELSFAQLENACYCCGKKGHNSNQCYKKDTIPKDQWYINRLQKQEMEKLQQHLQLGNNSNNNSNNNSETGSITSHQQQQSPTASLQEWSGLHITPSNENELKDLILLDNGSTTSVFLNPRMVCNIKIAPKPIKLATNAGQIELNMKATVQGFGEVWYNPNLPTNIFSFSELNKKHEISYDSTKEKAFLIHLPTKIIKFKMTTNGLYAYKPNEYVLNPINSSNTNGIQIAGVRKNGKKQMRNKNKNGNGKQNKMENKKSIKYKYELNTDDYDEEEITFEEENENKNEVLFENYE